MFNKDSTVLQERETVMRERCKMWDVPRTESDSARRSWKQALSYHYWNFISSFIWLNCISNRSLFNPTASKLVPCWLRFIIPFQTSLHFHTFPMWQIQKVTSSYTFGDHPQSSDCLRIPLLHQPLHVRLFSYCLTTSENSRVLPTVNPPELLEWAKCLPAGLWAIWRPYSWKKPLKVFCLWKFLYKANFLFSPSYLTIQLREVKEIQYFLLLHRLSKNCPNL